jgi:hypothetical protein
LKDLLESLPSTPTTTPTPSSEYGDDPELSKIDTARKPATKLDFNFTLLKKLYSKSKAQGLDDECHELFLDQHSVLTTSKDSRRIMKICHYLSGQSHFPREKQAAETASRLGGGASVFRSAEMCENGDCYGFIEMEFLSISLGDIKDNFSSTVFGNKTMTTAKDHLVHKVRLHDMAMFASQLEDSMIKLWNDGNMVHMDLNEENIRFRTTTLDTNDPLETYQALFIDFGRIFKRDKLTAVLRSGKSLKYEFPNSQYELEMEGPVTFEKLMEEASSELRDMADVQSRLETKIADSDAFSKSLGNNTTRVEEETQYSKGLLAFLNVVFGKTLEFKGDEDGVFQLVRRIPGTDL